VTDKRERRKKTRCVKGVLEKILRGRTSHVNTKKDRGKNASQNRSQETSAVASENQDANVKGKDMRAEWMMKGSVSSRGKQFHQSIKIRRILCDGSRWNAVRCMQMK
jgi:hypothetical protein